MLEKVTRASGQEQYGRMDGRTDGLIDGWTDQWWDGPMDGWTDGPSHRDVFLTDPSKNIKANTLQSRAVAKTIRPKD